MAFDSDDQPHLPFAHLSCEAADMKIFFDGGCRPNPGAMETAVVAGGRAFIESAGEGSSEEAEWRALLHALEVARSLGLRSVVLVGDALAVIRQASGLAKPRSREARACLATFRAQAAAFDSVRVRHIRRTQNLAGIALERRRARAVTSGPGRSPATRRPRCPGEA